MGRSAGRSGRVQTVHVHRRLNLFEQIFAGHKIVEGPEAAGIGGGRKDAGKGNQPARLSAEVCFLDDNRNAPDGIFARVADAVIVGVVIDVSAQRRRPYFGEIVVDAVFAAQQRHVGDDVFARGGSAG